MSLDGPSSLINACFIGEHSVPGDGSYGFEEKQAQEVERQA